MAWTETAVPPNPWVSTAGVPPSTWTPTPPCGTTVLVTTQQKTQTLYYVANSGQTLFSLGAADMFGNNVLLTDDTALIVSKGGLRLVPDDGTGAGGYTVDMLGNTITLLWPAGSSEILVVDIYDDTAIGIGPTGPAGPPGAAGADGAVGPQGPAGPPGGIPEAPQDNYPYARYMATWLQLPQTYIPEAPNTGQRFGRFNSTWQPDAIQTDAAADGNAYGRVNNDWASVLPTIGGTITGNLTVSGIMTVSGPNSLALNAPNGNQRAILGQTSGLTRWQLQLGDQTSEGAGNSGSNFSLSAYALTGTPLGTWLTIARADGATVFNGSGVTIAGGLAVNGLLALADLTHLAIYGGSASQVLTTNGSGVLSWTTPTGGGGGITDAPNDGTAYARKSAAWAHLAHTDITDWTATLAPYALTSAVPIGSGAAPAMNGAAAAGVATTWSRSDHVHPSDTSRAPLVAPAFTGNATFANGCTFVSGNLINGAVGTSRSMSGQTSGSTRWTMILGTGDAEGGSNAGSNFRIDGLSDAAGTLNPGAFAIDRHNAAVTINGTGSTWTSVSALPVGGAYINLNKLTGQTSAIYGSRNQQVRWEMDLGDTTAEGGSNAGSNFGLKCYADNGTTLLSAALTIMRSNGQVILPIGNVLNFANDAAAATGGVPVGGIYRNGSVLMIRAA